MNFREENSYGMFTQEGNEAVDLLVKFSSSAKLTWQETYDLLQRLSENDKFGEATDTEVRECVYCALFD